MWLPVEERATATAVMVTFVYFGISAGFIVGPLAIGSGGSDSVIESRLRSLYIVEAAIAAVLLVLVVCLFPKEPPRPPSRSATEKRDSFLQGMVRARICLRLVPLSLMSAPSAAVRALQERAVLAPARRHDRP